MLYPLSYEGSRESGSPVGSRDESNNPPSSTYAAAMNEGPRVLLVDDEPVILRVLEVNFRIAGFDVSTASTGAEALARAAEAPVDAVVLDLQLPDTDGLEVLERLRQTPFAEAAAIVFLTAHAQDDDVARGYASGVQDYVTKPFEPTELVETVRRAIARTAG